MQQTRHVDACARVGGGEGREGRGGEGREGRGGRGGEGWTCLLFPQTCFVFAVSQLNRQGSSGECVKPSTHHASSFPLPPSLPPSLPLSLPPSLTQLCREADSLTLYPGVWFGLLSSPCLVSFITKNPPAAFPPPQLSNLLSCHLIYRLCIELHTLWRLNSWYVCAFN